MALRHEPDVVQAAWFTAAGTPWTQLRSIGPSGFAQDGRLFHPLRHDEDERHPHHLANVEGHLEHAQLARLTAVLARHTSASDDCYFALGDGFGDIRGSPSVGFLTAGRIEEPVVPPAFPPEVLSGPRVQIPNAATSCFAVRSSKPETGALQISSRDAAEP